MGSYRIHQGGPWLEGALPIAASVAIDHKIAFIKVDVSTACVANGRADTQAGVPLGEGGKGVKT